MANHHQVAAQNRKLTVLRHGPLAGYYARFVYEGEVKGIWTCLQYPVTMDLPMRPAGDRKVIRVEFRNTEGDV
jgi:hypothetical protein